LAQAVQRGPSSTVFIAQGASRILLANRTRDRTEVLGRNRSAPAVSVVDWDARNQALAGCELLVNATSLGMTGKGPLDIEVEALPEDAVVVDIVYSPLETPLLATARARGRQTVDGLGMLLYQAVPGFERWFGVRPQVTKELKAHVAATLGGA
jgi:shikimate dehydrogenase